MNRKNNNKTVLVCGGAGYIGSHVVQYLVDKGIAVTVLDNLSTGHAESLPNGVELIVGSIGDRELLDGLFSSNLITTVVDLSANAYVYESIINPRKYYDNNVVNGLVLLEAMLDHDVRTIVFSSSCTVYGNNKQQPIDEQCSIAPVSPYGHTKAIFEQIMADFCQAYGLRYCALRYFNAAGAHPDGHIGEDHTPETHLIPLTLRKALIRIQSEESLSEIEPLQIYGNDYATTDGTCKRDYVHVMDLASAHYLALQYLEDGGETVSLNLANECGFTNLELVKMCEKISGVSIPYEIISRRPGDAGVLVGSAGKAQVVLGWDAEHSDIETIIGSAWRWHRGRPGGYGAIYSLL